MRKQEGFNCGPNAVIAKEKKGYCTCGKKINTGTLCPDCKKIQEAIREDRRSFAIE